MHVPHARTRTDTNHIETRMTLTFSVASSFPLLAAPILSPSHCIARWSMAVGLCIWELSTEAVVPSVAMAGRAGRYRG